MTLKNTSTFFWMAITKAEELVAKANGCSKDPACTTITSLQMKTSLGYRIVENLEAMTCSITTKTTWKETTAPSLQLSRILRM